MKKYAIVVAGGAGQRMGTAIPKQFLLLAGKPVLYHSVKAFLQCFSDVQVIVVLPGEHLQHGIQLLEDLNQYGHIHFTTGGATRFHSVQNGLQLIKEDSIVFVHDAVRCMIDAALLQRCYMQALQKGSAIPTVTATDTIRIVEADQHHLVDRNTVHTVQTPQTFQSALLLAAFKQPYSDAFTDEASVVEASGSPVHLIEGSYENLKITRPIDLLVAETLMQERSTLQ